jgi:hypothetical protein
MAGRKEGASAHGTREREDWKRIAGPGSSVEAKSAKVSKKELKKDWAAQGAVKLLWWMFI